MKEQKNELGQPIGYPVPDWKPAKLPEDDPFAGRYCTLVRLDPAAHAADLFESNALETEGRNWTYLPYGPFARLADYEAWMAETCLSDDPRFYAILDKETGKARGVASYLRIDPANGVIEVGHINFSPLLQRTRAATEAMYLMMRHAFEQGYRRYEWKCDSLNAPSRKAAARLGFTYEGTFRQMLVYKGRNRDTSWFAMIDREWPFLREAFETWLDPANFEADGRQRQSLSGLTKGALARAAEA